MINFDEVVKRLLVAKRLSREKEAAKILGISPGDFSTRKKRGSLLPLLVEWALVENIDLNWLLGGNKNLDKLDIKKEDLDFYKKLEEWGRESGKSEDTHWMHSQIESFFPMFNEWKKEKEKKDNKINDHTE